MTSVYKLNTFSLKNYIQALISVKHSHFLQSEIILKFGPCAIQTNDSLVHILSPTLLLEELPSWRLHFQPCSNKAACNFEVTLIILMEVMCNRHVVSKTGLVASSSSVLYVLC